MAILSRGRLGRRPAVVLAALVVGLLANRISWADPFDIVDLPKPSDEAPLDLGTVPAAEVAKCTFKIITPMTDAGPVGNPYACEPGGDAWKIFVDKGSPLATLKFDKDHLQFRWERGVARAQTAGLRNCLLQVGYGDKTKKITLRKPVRAAAQTVDLRRDSDTIALEVEDPPEGQTLMIEAFGLSGYGPPVTFNPENKQAIVKDPVRIIIKPADATSAGVQLNVSLTKLGSKLTVEVRPVAFTAEGENTRPFTLKSVSDAIERTKTNLTNTKSKLAAEEKKISPLEAKLASMSTTANRSKKQQTAFETQSTKLQGQIDAAKQKVDGMRKQIPTLQNQLDSLPTLLKLANDLNEHAAVEYRVLFTVGKQQGVLFATDKAPIEPPPPPKLDENGEVIPNP